MELKVIEKISEPLKSFETVDDISKYYMKHKVSIDQHTTHKLNKMYFIKDHRLTRIHGELQLKKRINDETMDEIPVSNDDLRERIAKIEEQLTEHKRVISNLVEFINGSNTQ